PHHFSGVLGVLVQVGDDVRDGDRIVVRVPAVIVGYHRHRHVADLGLARELGLLQIGHADDVYPPASVDVGLSLGGERGALHTKIRAAEFGVDARGARGLLHNSGKLWAHRLGEADVRYHALAEERGHPPARTIEKLIGYNEIQRSMFFL